MDFDCSQATLNALVKSLYSQEIEVGPDNVVEILTAADFLQASKLGSFRENAVQFPALNDEHLPLNH